MRGTTTAKLMKQRIADGHMIWKTRKSAYLLDAKGREEMKMAPESMMAI